MAFMLKTKRCDLINLAIEMGVQHGASDTRPKLKALITASADYKEEEAKDILQQIIADRCEAEEAAEKALAKQEAKEAEEKAWAKEQEERERAFELEKLKIQAEANARETTASNRQNEDFVGPKWELRKLIPSFDLKEDDMGLFLNIFERQLRFMKIPEHQWVPYLIGALPAEVTKLIARESEEEVNDYNHLKDMLLRRFKLSAEKFRQLFCYHRKKPEGTWRDYYFELRGYFEGWLSELNIQNFDQLKDLIIADQLKRKSGPELKDHYLDEWVECNDPGELADKFETFENLRSSMRRGSNPDYKGRNFHNPKDKTFIPQRRNENGPEARRENTRLYDRAPDKNGQEGRKKLQCFSCGSYEHLRNKCPRLGQRTQTAANRVDVQPLLVEEEEPHILTARVSVPVSTPIIHKKKINELEKISLKCGPNVIEGIVDTGAQISVIRADLIPDLLCDGEGKIKLISAFGETELAQLKVVHMKVNDGRHGEIPVTCAVSKKLVSEMLVSRSTFEALNSNIELGSGFTLGKTEVKGEAAGKALSQKSFREIGNQLSRLPDGVDSERQARVKVEKQKKDLKEELKAPRTELLGSEESAAAQKDLLTEREQELTMLKKTLEDETASHETQIGDIRQKHNAEIENLKEQLHLLEKTKTALEKVNSKLEVEKSELADEVNALSTSRQDSERKREQLELQLQDMAAKLSDLDTAKTDYAEKAQKLQIELDSESAQPEKLEAGAGADIRQAGTLESQLEESQDLAEETRQKLAFRPRFRQLESGKETLRDQLSEEELTKRPNETEIRDLRDSSESTDILINENNHKLYNDELSAFRNRIRKKVVHKQLRLTRQSVIKQNNSVL